MPSLRQSASALLLLPAAISAVTFDCSHVRVDKQSFDLSELGGPKTVHHQQYLPPSITNTTYTVDICKPIQRTKGVPKTEECPTGTRVCGIETVHNPAHDSSTVEKVIPIAGEYQTSHGRSMDPEVTRLKDSSSNDDSMKEGLRVELHGGKYPEKGEGAKLQKAIIEFICDKDLTGNEGFEYEKMLDAMSYGNVTRRAEDDDGDDPEPELPDLDKGKSLSLKRYDDTGDMGVLRLEWRTKYACEGANKDKPSSGGKNGAHWGFFTWFIIVLFLLAAAYIIFGSWLNYNRYGARGWDLVPHGDTIRDIPYIVKDWSGEMMDKVRGGGSRGGYSAV